MTAAADRETWLEDRAGIRETERKVARVINLRTDANIARSLSLAAEIVREIEDERADLLRLAREGAALRDGVEGLAEELEGWRDNARRYEEHEFEAGRRIAADQAHVRALAYQRAVEGLRALLDGGEGDRG